jgi:hypothetical protein
MPICGTVGLLIAGSLLLTGCGSAPLTALFDRSVRTDTLRPTLFHNPDAYVLSITGERRLMIATADGRTICAEPLPDVARAVDTNSKIDVSVTPTGPMDPKLAGKLEDAFKTSLTKTFDRRASIDMLGRLGALACMTYLNGIAAGDRGAYAAYQASMRAIIAGGIEAMKLEAQQR